MVASKYDSFCIIIEKVDKLNNKTIEFKDILGYLKSKGDSVLFYGLILHNQDYDELGCLKREHYHLVIKLSSKYVVNTIIKDISKDLLINSNVISCKGCIDFIKSVQYLIHQNDNDKTLYNVFDVYTNDVDELLSIMFDSVSTCDISIDYLIELTHKSRYITDVYKSLGMKYCRLYRPIIIDLWKDRFRNK